MKERLTNALRWLRGKPPLPTARRIAKLVQDRAYQTTALVAEDQHGVKWYQILSPLKMGVARAEEINNARTMLARRITDESLRKYIAGVRKAANNNDAAGVDHLCRIMEVDMQQNVAFDPTLHIIANYHLTERERKRGANAFLFIDEDELAYKVKTLRENPELAAFFLQKLGDIYSDLMASFGKGFPSSSALKAARKNQDRLARIRDFYQPITTSETAPSPESSATSQAKTSKAKTPSAQKPSASSGAPSRSGTGRNRLKG